MWFSVDHCFLNIKGRSFFLSLQTTTSLCLSLTTIWHVLILFPVNEQFSYRQKMLTVFFYCASKGIACASTLRSRPPTPYSSSHIPTDRDNKAPCIHGEYLGGLCMGTRGRIVWAKGWVSVLGRVARWSSARSFTPATQKHEGWSEIPPMLRMKMQLINVSYFKTYDKKDWGIFCR